MTQLIESAALLGNGTYPFGWSDTTWGYLAAFLALALFGSFSVPMKIGDIRKFDAIIFQVYMNFIIFCTSWITLTYNPFVFTWWGVLSAGLWITSSILSIIAIQNVGLSIAQGVWSGSTILVSFVWGLIFKEEMKSIGLSVLAIILILLGVAGISLTGSKLPLLDPNYGIVGASEANGDESDDADAAKLVDGQWKSSADSRLERNLEETVSLSEGEDAATPTEEPVTESRYAFAIGIGCALLLGITNGSMLAPIRMAPREASGINFIVSFGIGCLMLSPVFTIPYYAYKWSLPDFGFKTWLPLRGLICGTLWNIGNWASIYAVLLLGQAVGFTLCQTALLVAGLWGIFLFREISGWIRITIFFSSALVLLCGVALLAYFGHK